MNSSVPNATDTVVDAGPFGPWLAQAHAALRGNGGTNVPCGECVGCCTSSYSILLRPHDEQALDVVPVKFLSSVPSMHYPHAKMAPLTNGHCPMFQNGKCSIYAMRPQTCLDYDCRVFAAAGLEAGADKPVINQRIHAWRFSYASAAEQETHEAIRATAQFMMSKAACFPAGTLPNVPTGIAVLAIKTYAVLLDPALKQAEEGRIAAAILKASQAFDTA